ncbi:MAG: DUF4293 family protein [Bacteroidales bacterium]|nr:DUF4293 family protein [Bacteroidales bacterium]
MWQRQQTLFLLLSAGLIIALCFSTACLAGPDKTSYWQLEKPFFGILLGILAALVLLALVTYRSLILQMRLSSLGALVALGMQGWLAWMYFTKKDVTFTWTVIFPLAICVFNFLAARGCFQDQLMVESAQRLRNRRKRK